MKNWYHFEQIKNGVLKQEIYILLKDEGLKPSEIKKSCLDLARETRNGYYGFFKYFATKVSAPPMEWIEKEKLRLAIAYQELEIERVRIQNIINKR